MKITLSFHFRLTGVDPHQVKVRYLTSGQFSPSSDSGSFSLKISWEKPTFNYSALVSYKISYLTGSKNGTSVELTVSPVSMASEESISQTVFLNSVKAQILPKDVVAYYCTCIRSNLDYACPLFHHALFKYLVQLDLERVQKGPSQVCFPGFLTVKLLSLPRLSLLWIITTILTKRCASQSMSFLKLSTVPPLCPSRPEHP